MHILNDVSVFLSFFKTRKIVSFVYENFLNKNITKLMSFLELGSCLVQIWRILKNILKVEDFFLDSLSYLWFQAMGWKQFIVLYEESEALVRLQEVLKMSSQNRGLKITLRQLTPGPGKSGRVDIILLSN